MKMEEVRDQETMQLDEEISGKFIEEKSKLEKAMEFVKSQKQSLKEKHKALEKAREEWTHDWKMTCNSGSKELEYILSSVKKLLDEQAHRLNKETHQTNRLHRVISLRKEKLLYLEKQLSSPSSDYSEEELSPINIKTKKKDIMSVLHRIDNELQKMKTDIQSVRADKFMFGGNSSSSNSRANKENIPVSNNQRFMNAALFSPDETKFLEVSEIHEPYALNSTKQKWDQYFKKTLPSNAIYPYVRSKDQLQDFEKMICKWSEERTLERDVMHRHSLFLKNMQREMNRHRKLII